MALGPVNTRVYSVVSGDLNLSYSLTILTSLTNSHPVACSIREDTNNQHDFVDFVIQAVEAGYLTSGDYLILDNARIHGAKESKELLFAFLKAAGIQIYYLPTYSPELNPCELVFGYLKNHLRLHRQSNSEFKDEIIDALSLITRRHMFACYIHCFR
jgi:transposase